MGIPELDETKVWVLSGRQVYRLNGFRRGPLRWWSVRVSVILCQCVGLQGPVHAWSSVPVESQNDSFREL